MWSALKKRGNPVADQPGFADELLAYFNQLPTMSGFSLPSYFCRRPFWVPFANLHVSRSWVPARNSRLQRERERGDVWRSWVGGNSQRERETHTQSVCARVWISWMGGNSEREREREMGIGLHFGELGCSGGCHCCCSREPSNHCYTLVVVCPPANMRWM